MPEVRESTKQPFYIVRTVLFLGALLLIGGHTAAAGALPQRPAALRLTPRAAGGGARNVSVSIATVSRVSLGAGVALAAPRLLGKGLAFVAPGLRRIIRFRAEPEPPPPPSLPPVAVSTAEELVAALRNVSVTHVNLASSEYHLLDALPPLCSSPRRFLTIEGASEAAAELHLHPAARPLRLDCPVHAAGLVQVFGRRVLRLGDQVLERLQLGIVLILDQRRQPDAGHRLRLGAGVAGALLLLAEHPRRPLDGLGGIARVALRALPL